jgi:FixJ family two-component response regulator
MKRLRIQSQRQKAAAIVYWGLTELYIYRHKQHLPRPSQHFIDVVDLIAQDMTHAQIATKLSISKYAVATRVVTARYQVKANTEAHLVAIYWAEDWIS